MDGLTLKQRRHARGGEEMFWICTGCGRTSVAAVHRLRQDLCCSGAQVAAGPLVMVLRLGQGSVAARGVHGAPAAPCRNPLAGHLRCTDDAALDAPQWLPIAVSRPLTAQWQLSATASSPCALAMGCPVEKGSPAHGPILQSNPQGGALCGSVALVWVRRALAQPEVGPRGQQDASISEPSDSDDSDDSDDSQYMNAAALRMHSVRRMPSRTG